MTKFNKKELSLIAIRCREQEYSIEIWDSHTKDEVEIFTQLKKELKDTADMSIRNITNKIWEEMDEGTIQYVFNMEEDGDNLTEIIREKVGLNCGENPND